MSGHAKPGECLAILGPSGSGKTSLMNVLSGRRDLSYNSKFLGSVHANGKPLTRENFGKFAAFVQQDDSLMQSMTPREAFIFAMQIRTNYKKHIVEIRVEQLIETLGLEECADDQIGSGKFRASLLKKVSIGYEMVTNPSLIMLDEPTSGLDSIQALQIINLLKNEAKRGVTVMANIHQPSAEVFLLFDRCILISEGRMIYNGYPSKI